MWVDVGPLTFGDEALCPLYGGTWHGPLVHAAKDRCHKAAVGYEGKLSSSHPEYLVATRGPDLFLNMIDPPVPLFRAESFIAALDFIDERRRLGIPVGVHCNQGHSRAPSIALLYLAKRVKGIPDGSYGEARAAFEAMIPAASYAPGKGIETFLAGNWEAIR